MALVRAEELEQVARERLIAAGAPDEEAAIVAHSLVAANLAGHDSHGVLRLPQYLAAMRSGRIVPGAAIEIVHETPTTAVLDAHWGFGQVAARRAAQIALAKAEASSLAAVAVRRSNHVGRLGEFVELIAVDGMVGDIWTSSASGAGTPNPCAAGPYTELAPAWSSDGRFVCYTSDADGESELMLRETAAPHRRYQVTQNVVNEQQPHLGSPTLQTDRVIIGPAGADWGGGDPAWASAYAVIAAYGEQGYLNLVRIGIRPEDLDTLHISPLSAPAQPPPTPIGVVVEAAEVVNVREDGGRGQASRLWQLDALDPTAVILYFAPWTGKLQSVLVVSDQAYPAAAAGPAVTQRVEGETLVVEGSFAAVFDATGARIADAASAVSIADGTVSAVR